MATSSASKCKQALSVWFLPLVKAVVTFSFTYFFLQKDINEDHKYAIILLATVDALNGLLTRGFDTVIRANLEDLDKIKTLANQLQQEALNNQPQTTTPSSPDYSPPPQNHLHSSAEYSIHIPSHARESSPTTTTHPSGVTALFKEYPLFISLPTSLALLTIIPQFLATSETIITVFGCLDSKATDCKIPLTTANWNLLAMLPSLATIVVFMQYRYKKIAPYTLEFWQYLRNNGVSTRGKKTMDTVLIFSIALIYGAQGFVLAHEKSTEFLQRAWCFVYHTAHLPQRNTTTSSPTLDDCLFSEDTTSTVTNAFTVVSVFFGIIITIGCNAPIIHVNKRYFQNIKDLFYRHKTAAGFCLLLAVVDGGIGFMANWVPLNNALLHRIPNNLFNIPHVGFVLKNTLNACFNLCMFYGNCVFTLENFPWTNHTIRDHEKELYRLLQLSENPRLKIPPDATNPPEISFSILNREALVTLPHLETTSDCNDDAPLFLEETTGSTGNTHSSRLAKAPLLSPHSTAAKKPKTIRLSALLGLLQGQHSPSLPPQRAGVSASLLNIDTHVQLKAS